nr:odorant receptor 70 [Ceracris nigricornis]
MTDQMHSGGEVWDTTKEAEAMLGPSAGLMRRMGLWQPPGGEPAGAKVLVAVAMDVMFFLIFAGGLVQILLDPPPMDSMLEVSLTLACSITWAVRNMTILVRQNQLQQLVLDLLNMRRRFTENGEFFRKKYYRRSLIGSTLLLGIPMFAIPMWLVEPALTKTLVTTSENATVVVRRTPLVMWMPMDTQTHPNYEIAYTFQLLLISIVVNANIVIDIFVCCLIITVTADIAVLNHNIANMRMYKERFTENSEEGVRISRTWEITYKSKKPQMEESEQYDDRTDVHASYTTDSSARLYRTLVKNIQHHQLLMSIVNDLESIMSESSVLMLALNSINICSQGIGFVDGFRPGTNKTTVLKRFLTFPAYVNQTAHFCWYGQDIIDQSERLLESAFNCGWPDADQRFCRTLRIFMLQATRPLKLQIGKIFTLSRNLFLQILNTSYTIFNMFINF